MCFLCSFDLLFLEKEASEYHDVCMLLSAVFSLLWLLQFFKFAHFHFQPGSAVAQGCQTVAAQHVTHLHYCSPKPVAFICPASDTS